MLALFLDIETTGLDPRDHCPVELALKIFDLSQWEVVVSYERELKLSREQWERHDPKSLEINGCSWERVQQGSAFSTVREELVALFRQHQIVRGKAVFICQNPAFDRSFLTQIIPIPLQEQERWPYHWLDLASMYWALLIKESTAEGKLFPETLVLSKNAIAEQFNIAPEAYPHRAINGVDHLIACYEALFKG